MNLNAKTSSGNTALHTAAKNGQLEIVKYLVEKANKARNYNQAKYAMLDK